MLAWRVSDYTTVAKNAIIATFKKVLDLVVLSQVQDPSESSENDVLSNSSTICHLLKYYVAHLATVPQSDHLEVLSQVPDPSESIENCVFSNSSTIWHILICDIAHLATVLQFHYL